MVKIEFKPVIKENFDDPRLSGAESVANAADVASYFGAQFKS